jgi:hypothetical protein
MLNNKIGFIIYITFLCTLTNIFSASKKTRIEQSEKPLACDFSDCTFRSISPKSLQGHIKINHTECKEYYCDYPRCEFSTKYQNSIKGHKERHRKNNKQKKIKVALPPELLQKITYTAYQYRASENTLDCLLLDTTEPEYEPAVFEDAWLQEILKKNKEENEFHFWGAADDN